MGTILRRAGVRLIRGSQAVGAQLAAVPCAHATGVLAVGFFTMDRGCSSSLWVLVVVEGASRRVDRLG